MCLYFGVDVYFFFFFKQKTAYEMRISDWSSDVCSSDLHRETHRHWLLKRYSPRTERLACRYARGPAPRQAKKLIGSRSVSAPPSQLAVREQSPCQTLLRAEHRFRPSPPP